jgi:peptidoglycan hydrolase-like amidase
MVSGLKVRKVFFSKRKEAMQHNPYYQKVKANWEQFQADWHKKTAKMKEAKADAQLQMKMDKFEKDLENMSEASEDKLEQWSKSAQAKIAEFRAQVDAL